MPDTAQLVQPAAELDAMPPAFTSFSEYQTQSFHVYHHYHQNSQLHCEL